MRGADRRAVPDVPDLTLGRIASLGGDGSALGGVLVRAARAEGVVGAIDPLHRLQPRTREQVWGCGEGGLTSATDSREMSLWARRFAMSSALEAPVHRHAILCCRWC